jgi:hypothetical protein
MSFNVVLNSTNLIGNTYSQFRYNFISGGFVVGDGYEVCLTQCTIPYSFYNISSFYQNNTFSYNFPTANVANLFTQFDVLIPDGNYSVPQLTAFIQNYMINLGQYVIDNNGKNVYFIQIIPNSVFYANQILEFPVYTALTLPVGWTTPTLWPGFPLAAITPQMIINNANFGTIIGFAPGTYPNVITTTTYSILSNIVPNASPVNAIVVLMNIVKNQVANPPNILSSFAINSSFGTNINFNPSIQSFVSIPRGIYNSFDITLVDQNYETIKFQDPNVLITLIIRKI